MANGSQPEADVASAVGDTGNVSESRVKASRFWRSIKIWARMALTAVALILQLVVFFGGIMWFQELSSWVTVVSVTISVLVVAYVLNSRMTVEYKMAWIIVILLMPLFGGAFYVLFGSRSGSHRWMNRYRKIQERFALDQRTAIGAVAICSESLPGVPAIADSQAPRLVVEALTGSTDCADVMPTPIGLLSLPGAPARQALMISESGPFMAYRDTGTTYYPSGEAAFGDMLAALESAENWIAMEYFIVADGVMLDRIVDVLFRKAAQGVQVWFMYDDWGSVWRLPTELPGQMRAAGIQVHAVNKLGLGLTLRYNNRDHRKMTIVDGVTAFTGGINIADEYINEETRFGYWKDTSLRLQGPGAWGLASLFFTLWEQTAGEPVDIAALHPQERLVASHSSLTAGVVMSYDDDPFDDLSVGWDAYRGMMTKATTSIDVMTPYFIPTGEMISVFRSAAASGVRVRMITPGIPDKKAVYAVTRSYYAPLVEAGVEIYEYTPGFLHAKQMIVDNEMAIIGTINFDYRSFYLHQENAVWMYQTSAIKDMTADFDEAIAVSRRVTLQQVRATPWIRRFWATLVRTFSVML